MTESIESQAAAVNRLAESLGVRGTVTAESWGRMSVSTRRLCISDLFLATGQDQEEIGISEFVSEVESALATGNRNVNLSPVDSKETENAFLDAGWRNVMIEKGQFMVKGSWKLFIRTSTGSVIVQWDFLRADEVVVESEPTLFG